MSRDWDMIGDGGSAGILEYKGDGLRAGIRPIDGDWGDGWIEGAIDV